MDALQTCSKCGVAQNVNAFYSRRASCKDCVTARVRQYGANNKDKRRIYLAANAGRIKQNSKEWRAANVEHLRAYNEANAERYRAKREANAESKKAYDAARYKETPGIVKSRVNAWRTANIDRVRAYLAGMSAHISERGKRYLEIHRDRITKNKRKFYSANSEKLRADKKQWCEENPEKVKAQWRRKRNRLNSAEGSHTEAEWRALVKTFGGYCLCCKNHFGLRKLTEDHVIPLTRGGSDFIANIQPLCYSCNSSKGNRHATDYRIAWTAASEDAA
jgi:5-methylcytosine-specific restriction endonuclease McrA